MRSSVLLAAIVRAPKLKARRPLSWGKVPLASRASGPLSVPLPSVSTYSRTLARPVVSLSVPSAVRATPVSAKASLSARSRSCSVARPWAWAGTIRDGMDAGPRSATRRPAMVRAGPSSVPEKYGAPDEEETSAVEATRTRSVWPPVAWPDRS
jgi:hypothetical protein